MLIAMCFKLQYNRYLKFDVICDNTTNYVAFKDKFISQLTSVLLYHTFIFVFNK